MASDHMIRASDRDRDDVVTALREAYAEGRLSLEEFDERTSDAYASRTWGELRELTQDLPSQPVLGSGLPGRPRPPDALPPYADRTSGRPPPASRRHQPVAFLPLVALWIVLALATQSAHSIVAPMTAMMMVLVFVSLARRR